MSPPDGQTRRQEGILLSLMSRGILFEADLQTAVRAVTEACSDLLETERVGVWLYDREYATIRCIDLYERSGRRHTEGERLSSSDFPVYAASHRLGSVIAASDVHTDPRTRDIPPAYLQQHDIRSLLDAPVWLHGQMTGVLSFEEVGCRRSWSQEEARLSTMMAAMLTLCFEASERKRAEEALRRTNQTLQTLIDASPLAIVTVDTDGNVNMWSPAAERIFGWTESEVRGRRYAPVPDDRWDEVRDAIDLALRGATVSNEERIRRRKDGSLVSVSVSTAPLRDATGQVVGVMAILADTTERKRAEEELRVSEEKFARLFMSSPNSIVLAANESGRFFDVNDTFLRHTGYSREEVIGHTVDELGLWPDEHEKNHFRREFAEAGRVRDMELLWRHKSGEVRSALTSAETVSIGGKLYTLATSMDITERKRAESERAQLQEQLHESQKMEAVGQLAGGVAHDFNNLLTVILTSLDMLTGQLPTGQTAAEIAGTIRSAAQQAVGVARALLAFSRGLSANREATKLHDVILTTTRMLRSLLPASIEVVVDSSPEPPLWINADPTQLQQVLLNLAVNARDAMPKGGTLRIAASAVGPEGEAVAGASQAPESACLIVSDTGSGIPEEVRSRMFEPFFSTRPRGQGTGLGLSIVHGIVENHGGRIEVDSEVGKGSTFRVFLPLMPSETRTESQDAAVPVPRGHGETILLAEDNQFVRGSIVSVLRRLGYDVIPTVDGPSCLDAWRSNRDRVKLLLLDVDLPGKRGIDCLHDVRAEDSSVPVLIITGSVDQLVEDEIDSHTLLLRKPFNVETLAILAGRLLQAPAPLEEHLE